jgi:hypothetical protein
MSAETAYVKGIDKQLGYLATWLPTTDIHVGDIGRFDGPTFVPTSSLSARRMRFRVQKGAAVGDLSAQIGRGIRISAKVRGETNQLAPSIPRAKAGAVVQFSSDESAIFSASGCVQDRVEDVESLMDDIERLYDNWQWPKDLVVVTHVVRAKKATILVSSDKGATFELTAAASQNAGPVDVGKLSGGWSLASSYNSSLSLVSRSNLTPLFRAIKIKGFWWPEAGPADAALFRQYVASGRSPRVDSPGAATRAKLVAVKASDVTSG